MTMSKPVITDEMVERALHAFWHTPADLSDDSIVLRTLRKTARRALEAALTEPEEIPVSSGMQTAGVKAYAKYCNWSEDRIAFGGMEEAYRAMERKRREEAEGTHRSQSDGKWFHCRKGEACGPWPAFRRHRRKDDPK